MASAPPFPPAKPASKDRKKPGKPMLKPSKDGQPGKLAALIQGLKNAGPSQ